LLLPVLAGLLGLVGEAFADQFPLESTRALPELDPAIWTNIVTGASARLRGNTYEILSGRGAHPTNARLFLHLSGDALTVSAGSILASWQPRLGGHHGAVSGVAGNPG